VLGEEGEMRGGGRGGELGHCASTAANASSIS